MKNSKNFNWRYSPKTTFGSAGEVARKQNPITDFSVILSPQTRKTMKKYLLIIPVAVVFFLQGCSKDDENNKKETVNTISCFNSNAQYSIGDTIYIENCSSNATAYSWLVNGNEVSTDENFNYVFESEGTYTLTLRAYNDSEAFTFKEDDIVIEFPLDRTLQHDYLELQKFGYVTGLHVKNNEFYLFQTNRNYVGSVDQQLFITKYDQDFNQQWKKLVFNTNYYVRYTPMMFLDASVKANVLTDTDNPVIELDLDGNYINTEDPAGTVINLIERDNRFFQVGYRNIFPHEGAISEFSSAGNLITENTLTGEPGESLFVTDIQIVGGTIYALIGTYETENDIDFYIATLDNNLDIISTVRIETNITVENHPELIFCALKQYDGKLYANISGKLYRIDGETVDIIFSASIKDTHSNFGLEIANNYIYVADQSFLHKLDVNGLLVWKREILNDAYTYNINIVNNNIIFDRTYTILDDVYNNEVYIGEVLENKSYIGMVDDNGVFIDISQ